MEYPLLFRGFTKICLLVPLVCKTLSQCDLMDQSEDATRWVAHFSGIRLTDAPESIRNAKGLSFTRMLHLTLPRVGFPMHSLHFAVS